MAVIVVSLTTVYVAFVVPSLTRLVPVKWLPVSVTRVPTGPVVGAKLVITGGVVTVKLVGLVPVPVGVVTAIAPVCAPVGTVA